VRPHTTEQEVRARLRALSISAAPALRANIMPVRAVQEIVQLGIALHELEPEEARN